VSAECVDLLGTAAGLATLALVAGLATLALVAGAHAATLATLALVAGAHAATLATLALVAGLATLASVAGLGGFVLPRHAHAWIPLLSHVVIPLALTISADGRRDARMQRACRTRPRVGMGTALAMPTVTRTEGIAWIRDE
jgi:hypothetical protein